MTEDPGHTVEMHNNVNESLTSCSDSASNQPLHEKTSNRRLKRGYSMPRSKDLKQHLVSFKSCKKLQSSAISEPENEDYSTYSLRVRHHRVRYFTIDRDSSIDRPERSRRLCNKEQQDTRPAKERVQEALYYKSDRFAERLSQYDDQVARSETKWAEWLQVQMKLQVFD